VAYGSFINDFLTAFIPSGFINIRPAFSEHQVAMQVANWISVYVEIIRISIRRDLRQKLETREWYVQDM